MPVQWGYQCNSSSNCSASLPNRGCEDLGDHCFDHFAGGGGDNPLPEAGKDAADYADFIPGFIVVRCTEAMWNGGICAGDFITHVNGESLKDAAKFGEAVKHLPAGTRLMVVKPDGRRMVVTLK